MIEGLKILNFTHYLQGPIAAQMLADLGAEVVKVEPVAGAFERSWSGPGTFLNGVSTFFMLANRNMKSMAVNLKTEAGHAIILRLIGEYDVIIENFRPGAMERLGLSYEQLKRINPRLIFCSCSGYGPAGPYKDLPGQDLVLQSMTGLCDMTGSGDASPMPAGTTVVDIHGAALAALGVVSAAFDRAQTGQGHKVDSTLLSAGLDLQCEALGHYLNQKESVLPRRASTGLASRVHSSPYGIYKTLDGYIAWTKTPLLVLKEIFEPGVLDQFTEEDKTKKRLEFDAVFAAQVKKQTTAYWRTELTKHGIWNTDVETYADVEQNPQVLYNRSILSFEHPVAGKVRVLGNPLRFDGEAPPLRSVPPELGQNTREMLQTAGYTEKEIAGLAEQGVIRLAEQNVE